MPVRVVVREPLKARGVFQHKGRLHGKTRETGKQLDFKKESGKWHRRTYLWGSRGDADVENRTFWGKDRVGRIQRAARKRTRDSVQKRQPVGICCLPPTRGLCEHPEGWDGEGGGSGAQEGGDLCLPAADAC